jgi:hypothetical protein
VIYLDGGFLFGVLEQSRPESSGLLLDDVEDHVSALGVPLGILDVDLIEHLDVHHVRHVLLLPATKLSCIDTCMPAFPPASSPPHGP